MGESGGSASDRKLEEARESEGEYTREQERERGREGETRGSIQD